MARGHKKTAENATPAPTRTRSSAVRSQSQTGAATITTRRCTRSLNNIQSLSPKSQGKSTSTPPRTRQRHQTAKATGAISKATTTIRADTRSAKRKRTRSSTAVGSDPEDGIQSQRKKTHVSNPPEPQSQRAYVSRNSQNRSERPSNVNNYHEQPQQQSTLLLIHASAPSSSTDNAIYLRQAEQIIRGFEVSRRLDISQTSLQRPESYESLPNRQVGSRDIWLDDIDEDSVNFNDLEEVWRKYDNLQPYLAPVKAITSPAPGNSKGHLEGSHYKAPWSQGTGKLSQRSSICLSQLDALLEPQLDPQLRSRNVTPSSTQYSDIPFLLPEIDAASLQGSSIPDSQIVPGNYHEALSSPVLPPVASENGELDALIHSTGPGLPEILTSDQTSPQPLTSESIGKQEVFENHPSSLQEIPRKGLEKAQCKSMGQKGNFIHRSKGKAPEVPAVPVETHKETQKRALPQHEPSSRSHSQEIPSLEVEAQLTSSPHQPSPLLLPQEHQQQRKPQTPSRLSPPLLLKPREFMYKFPPPLQFNLFQLSPHTSQQPHSPPSTTSTPNLSRHPLPCFSSSPPSVPPLAKLIPKPHYILPPDPCPGEVNINPDQVTRYLAHLEQKPHTWRPYFAPVEVKRELRQWERGCWIIRMGAQAGWVSRKEKIGFWEVVSENVKEGRLGMVGVWLGSEDSGCTTTLEGKPVGASSESGAGVGVEGRETVREEVRSGEVEGDGADVVKIYCWGKVAELVWAFLFVVSNRKTRWGLKWVDSAGEAVIRC